MANKLSFVKSDKIKILPVDDKSFEKVDLATPMGLIEVNGEYKAKRFTAGTEYIGILASKYIPFQEIYIEPISVGTVYTVRVEGACNVGDTLAPVEDGYFEVGNGNLKVIKKINTELVEAVGISTGQGGGGQPYTLPIASDKKLGGIKVGANLTIEADGKLNGQPQAIYDDSQLKKDIESKQDKLTAGNNIEIINNVISATVQGGGGGNIDGATLNGQAVPIQNKTLNITVDKNTVELNNVDNTSDANKPISTAVQDALDLKADTTALTKETQDRENADTTLQNNIDTEKQNRETADNGITAKVEALNKIVVYAKDAEVKQNWIVLHAGKVYIAKENITLSTWDIDEPKLILTDSDTISCVSYAPDIKIEKGQLVIYQQGLYLCDTTVDKTTDWNTDSVNMISQQAKVDLKDYFNKTETTQLLNAKQDSLTAGAGINITQNEIKVNDTIYTKAEADAELAKKVNQDAYDTKITEIETAYKQADTALKTELETKITANTNSIADKLDKTVLQNVSQIQVLPEANYPQDQQTTAQPILFFLY